MRANHHLMESADRLSEEGTKFRVTYRSETEVGEVAGRRKEEGRKVTEKRK